MADVINEKDLFAGAKQVVADLRKTSRYDF